MNNISLLDLCTFCIMPVTTRSQTKHLTSLLAESSMTSTLPSTNLLNISGSEPNDTIIHEAYQRNDTFNHEVSLNTFVVHKLSSAVLDSSTLSSITTSCNSDNISNLNTVEFQNLKPSMVLSCPYSVSNLSSSFNPHNSEILSNYLMESDYEDFATGSHPNLCQVDINKLFHQ